MAKGKSKGRSGSSNVIPSFDDLPDGAFIRESQLVRHNKHPDKPVLLQFSPATLWRYVKAGLFPRPYKLSARITAWKVGEVRAWISARMADVAVLGGGAAAA